ncbi:MAG: zinc-dependent metalloprotease, partial [Betaproteobacteria bacterium]|nr:zinc-dependent metalloprotease [Betaproteobacteria bacterium]
QVALAATVAAKYVGGVVLLRDHADSGRAPLNPVPAAKQRQALKLITDGLFRSESFKFKPEFVARLVPDQFERQYGGGSLAAAVNPDVSISGAVLNLQRGALDQLMSDAVAARIIDSPSKMTDAKQALALSELYDTLQNAIWSELKTGGDINPLRRNLQRDHLRRVVNSLIKPSPSTPADARSLQRANAIALQGQIRAAMAKAGNKETKAHLSESLDLLNEALKAPLQRSV